MERIHRHAFVQAPPGRIFAWLGEPGHWPEIWPSMVEVSNVTPQPNGERSFDWTYRMAGVKFRGRSEVVEVEPDRLRVVRNGSGIPSTFRWHFAPRDGGTELGLDVEYEIPGKLLGGLAGPILRRLNEHEADTLVRNLKARMEAEARH